MQKSVALWIAIITLVARLGMLSGNEPIIILIDPTNNLWAVDESRFKSEFMKQCKKHALGYMLRHGSANFQDGFEKFLVSLGAQQQPSHLMVRGQNGEALSALLVDWLRGKVNHEQLMQTVHARARDKIFNDIARIAFHPGKMADNTEPRAGAAAFVDACVNAVGAEHVYLVGNWDPASFQALLTRAHIRAIVQRIPADHFLVSGTTHCVLPCEFEAVIRLLNARTGLAKDAYVFVTAMPTHAQAAQTLGIRAILVGQSFSSALASIRAMVQQAAS